MKDANFRKMALLLAAMMTVSLAACGDSGSSDKESAADAVSSAAEETPAEESSQEEAVTTAPEESEAEVLETVATKAPADVLADLPVEEAKSATLTEVGKFKADDISFYGDMIYKLVSDDEVEVYDYLGNAFPDENAVYVDALGDTGLYTYQIDGDDVLYSGLVDAQCNIILDGSAKVGTFEDIDERFIKAYIPEKVTTNKDEAIYYQTNRQFSLDVKDEDIMYAGTVKIYDTVNRKFLESSAQSYDPYYSVHGDIITFYDADNEPVAISAETDEVLDLGDMAPTGRSLLVQYKDGQYYCYDHSQQLQFVTPYSLSELDGNSEFVSIYDSESGLRGIMHESGAVMIEPKYSSINQLNGQFFTYNNDDFSAQGLVKLDGTEVGGCEYKYISDIGTPGYFSVGTQDGKYSLIDETGKAVHEGEDYGYSEGGYIKDGDDYKHLVISKGEFSLTTESSGDYLGNFLLFDYKGEALYDLVTGEKVFEDVDKVYSAFGRIYVLKDKEYTVYEIAE